ncbi:VWA domain-containing protein [Leptospira sp. 2 VSF19]|uniref:VWA domain-containing protein n=1 Tax=Leptospira soteropolitanensis TaxID=2950025 RepID=A0AAW5VGE7_9LEPT|nr:VWA domain-containing protein [Leptospira soteropolitanensis]MCW7492714.1 VWA domain-containing protein [Leptospira soteropolitanensis]MCW7500397.1 VWA domain-containing protein [Leptospira soteropolitanensis]MCW7522568.1 VWA domain-containing protein [Leptospira soteropolitanensis]MCW7526424.1 VWA domain-containing protein [Leptospira soteropolitanensis]MCW7530367.1 VWA domain-containing protein [Leptospira soteropolitanensis]
MTNLNLIATVALLCIFIWILVFSLKLYINVKANLFKEKHPNLKNRIYTSNTKIYVLRILSFLLALFFAFYSLFKTKSTEVESLKEFESADIMFVVDVSLSMNAIDVKPSRLKRFQDLALRILPCLKGNRVGIVVFAGQSFSFCPLTSDISAVSDYIQALGVEMVGAKGTDLAVALERVNKIRKKNNNISSQITIVVSDGEDHENQNLPSIGGEVMVWGIGTPEGGYIEYRDPGTGKGGYVTLDAGISDSPMTPNLVISKMNIEKLKAIAEQNDGSYYDVSFEAEGAYALLDTIQSIKKKKIQSVERFKNEDGAHPFLIAAIGFLLLERVLTFFMQKIPTNIYLVLLLLISIGWGRLEAWELDPGGNSIERGVKSYHNKNFNESKKEFDKAKEYIKDDPKLFYNESATAYQLGQYKEAKELSEKILAHPKADQELKAKANFNLGNIYARLGDKKNALKSYTDTLRIDPDHLAAKKNIEHLTKKKEQAPNQNPKNNESNQEPPQNNKQKKPEEDKSDAERILEPFSQDTILKNKKGGSFDNEKFW